MPILQSDLKIIKSQFMTDEPDGGGLPSSEVVISGNSNEIFDDVSDLNTITGNVTIRKVFLGVDTENDDKLLASRFIFTELPENQNVSVFAFKPTDWADRREDAQDKIESYLAFGTKFPGHLLETQLEGQKVIQMSLDLDDRLPAVGDVLVLIQNFDQDDSFFQFVRTSKITVEQRSFQVRTDLSIKRNVVTVELSNSLEHTFVGLTVREFYTGESDKRKGIVHESRVANAAKYYSGSTLTQPAVLGDRQLNLKSIYVPIVPSTETETVMPQVTPTGRGTALIPSSGTEYKYTFSGRIENNTSLFMGSSFVPGTLRFPFIGKELTDKGGQLIDSSGLVYGSVNYNTGQIIFTSPLSSSGTFSFYFIPAKSEQKLSRTDFQFVPKVGAGFNYILTLPEEPTPGSLEVSYQVDGNVYYLRDIGDGTLVGSQGAGAGSLSDRTVTITAGEIPDSQSIIVYTYTESQNSFNYANSLIGKMAIKIPLPPEDTIIPDTLKITYDPAWTSASGEMVAGDFGKLTNALGDTGQIMESENAIYIYLNRMDPKGITLSIEYASGVDSQVLNGNMTKSVNSSSDLEIILPGTNVIYPQTVSFDFRLDGVRFYVKDDGNGNIIIENTISATDSNSTNRVDAFGRPIATQTTSSNLIYGTVVGSIDYDQRKIILTSPFTISNLTTAKPYVPSGPTVKKYSPVTTFTTS